MEELATAVGVTKPVLYNHFADRAGLLSAVAGAAAGELYDELRGALAGTGTRPELIRAAVEAFVRFVENEPQLSELLGPGAEVSGRVDRDVRFAELLGSGLGLGGAGDEPQAFAPAFIGAVFAATDWWRRTAAIERDVLVDQLVTLLWGGIAAA